MLNVEKMSLKQLKLSLASGLHGDEYKAVMKEYAKRQCKED